MKFRGSVVHGVQVGAKFGIATANLEVDEMPTELKEGVYFITASFDSTPHNGLLHFGPRKTFGADSTIEIHLLDVDLDLYEKELEIDVLKRERDIEQFQNADALFTQVEKDIVRARKFFLRSSIADQWKKISPDEREQMAFSVLERIATNENFKSAQNIYVYAPIEGEIEFVQKMCSINKEKTFFFPKIENDEMMFHRSAWEDLKEGAFGILEPSPSSDVPEPDLVFVPAVALDARSHRLGKGGGFYDQFLKTFKGHTIAVVPSFAHIKSLPTEGHDEKVSEVIAV
jgi:5-formyltetrahydrofolate cyclo-ligase